MARERVFTGASMERIALEEIYHLADEWFHSVASGEPGSSTARLFRYPDARIYVDNGQAFSLDEHCLLHARWTDESHVLGDFRLTPLCDAPPRVRAKGTVYWEARYLEAPSAGPDVIKAVVGEDWIVERRPDGKPCFVLYQSIFYHLLPGSAHLLL